MPGAAVPGAEQGGSALPIIATDGVTFLGTLRWGSATKDVVGCCGCLGRPCLLLCGSAVGLHSVEALTPRDQPSLQRRVGRWTRFLGVQRCSAAHSLGAWLRPSEPSGSDHCPPAV